MLNLYISKLSTASTDMADMVVDKIVEGYRQQTGQEPFGGEYYSSATNMVTAFLGQLIQEFVQQYNAGAEAFILDDFKVNLEDEYSSAYASDGLVDDEFLQYVGDWLDDGDRLKEWEEVLDPEFQSIRAMPFVLAAALMVPNDRLMEMLLVKRITFFIVQPDDIEWSSDIVPFHLEASSLFSTHEFSGSDYVFVQANGRVYCYDPAPSYAMIPRDTMVQVGRLTKAAKDFVEEEICS